MTPNATLNTYQVSFNANGGTGTMSAQTFSHGVAANLNANTFTREGYTFVEWMCNGQSYGAGTSVSKLTTKNNAIVVITAVWRAN